MLSRQSDGRFAPKGATRRSLTALSKIGPSWNLSGAEKRYNRKDRSIRAKRNVGLWPFHEHPHRITGMLEPHALRVDRWQEATLFACEAAVSQLRSSYPS
jgi:hypothetical protein